MADEKQPILQAKGLKKVYGTGETSLTVLDDLDLDVEKGSIVAIVGRSGSGKSTLLHLLGGLDRPTSGTISVGGQPIQELAEETLSELRNRRIGFIFQFHHLLTEFTVLENVMMPLLIEEFDRGRAEERAKTLLKSLGILEKKDFVPAKLSGGESQRVAIARALANAPEIILADEPTGNLDIANAEMIKDLLFDIVHTHSHTMIIVTHSVPIVEDADRVLELSNGVLRPKSLA